MNDQEKSTLLFEAMGWQMRNTAPTNPSKSWRSHDAEGGLVDYVWFPKDYTDDSPPVVDLYAPANMPLAWRVLNWAMNQIYMPTLLVFLEQEAEVFFLSPAEAQRAWLDKILELAIEAGSVEESET